MIGTKLGRYEIAEQLGAGGMGVVYRAWDSRLERDVALKILPPGTVADETARKRFRKEALALSRLNHPNIATIHDFDSENGVDFLVMELIPGRTLHGTTIAEKDLVKLGQQLASGLAAAHGAGVLHRDLKPSNLRVTPDGRMKILDFGLARLQKPLTTHAETDSVATVGGIFGTIPYMAPEQLRGEDIDERTDVYGAGAALYELITGRPPFTEGNSARLIQSILNEEPPRPRSLKSSVSPALEQIVLKALDKEPDRRYQSAKELAVDLARLTGSTDAAIPYPKKRPRRRVVAAVGGVAVVALALLLISPRVREGFSPRSGTVRAEPIAVLPLTNASGDPKDDHFADGVTVELTRTLARLDSLQVTNPITALAYRKRKKTLPQIAAELGVSKVVQGSVSRGPQGARLELELIDTTNGQRLWSQTYESDLTTILAVQGSAAVEIARQAGARVSRRDSARLTTEPKVNAEAHEAFLKGVYLSMSGPAARPAGTPQKTATEYWEEAVRIDPTFAPAFTALAGELINQGFFRQTIAPMEAYPKAKELALKALALDDSDSMAHSHIATVKLHHEWDLAGAEASFKRAIELNPSSAMAHHTYAHQLLAIGRLDESVIETRKASDLDPLNPAMSSCVGWHCLYARQYDEAVDQCMRIITDDRAVPLTYFYLGRVYVQMGKLPEGIAALQTAVEKNPLNPIVATLGYALGRAGKREEALQVLAKLQERSKTRYVSALDFAIVYSGLGEDEHVFEWLDKAFLERSTWLVHIGWDDRFAPYRSHPRFIALLRRMGLPGGSQPVQTADGVVQ